MYDILGYFLPGIPAVLGVVVLFWLFCRPGGINVSMTQPASVWVAFGLAAYFLGHVIEHLASVAYGDYWETCRSTYESPTETAEALGSWPRAVLAWVRSSFCRNTWVTRGRSLWAWVCSSFRFDTWVGRCRSFLNCGCWDANPQESYKGSSGLWWRSLQSAREGAAKEKGCEENGFPMNWLFTFVSKRASTNASDRERRELVVYREGFYKNSSLSFLFLGVSLLIRAIRTAKLLYTPVTMDRGDFVFSGIVCLLISLVFTARAYKTRLSRCVNDVDRAKDAVTANNEDEQ